MANTLSLVVEKRQLKGRKVKQLRRNQIVPANIYGNNVDSLAIQLPELVFHKLYEQAGDTSVVEIKVEGESKKRPVLVSRLHHDPITSALLHVDFRQVDLTETVNAMVPVEVIGESVAVKEQGALMIVALDEVEVEALPQDLPNKIVVDATTLKEIDDAILVKDLTIDASKVTMLTELDTMVVSIQLPDSEQPEEEVEAGEAGEVAEAETTVQGQSAEDESEAASKPE